MRTARTIWTAATLCAALAVPSIAQVQNPPPVTGMTPAQQQQVADAATAAATAQQTATDAATAAAQARAAIPTPATAMPPGVSDSGAIGTATTVYALANHTHASKARKITATTAADGSLTWTFATPFNVGTLPVCSAVAEVASGVTDVVNVQIVGTPSATSATFLANRAQRSTQVLNLVSLTLLQILPTSGATKIHAICLEP